MGIPAEKTRLTFAEYLALETADAEVRHELVDGRMWAMTGATWPHVVITSNTLVEFANALSGRPCRAVSQDARVRIAAFDMACYPDVLVVCDERAGAPEDPHSTTNPVVIVEVLSRSTEAFDRGRKRVAYFALESLQHYVLISQDRPRIEVYTRAEDAWILRAYGPGDAVALPALEIGVPVDPLYEGVDFSATSGESSGPPVAG